MPFLLLLFSKKKIACNKYVLPNRVTFFSGFICYLISLLKMKCRGISYAAHSVYATLHLPLITACQSRTSQFRFVRFSSEPQDLTCCLSLVLVQYRITLVGSNLFLFCLFFSLFCSITYQLSCILSTTVLVQYQQNILEIFDKINSINLNSYLIQLHEVFNASVPSSAQASFDYKLLIAIRS